MNFTQEQLQIIAQYPTKAIERAHRRLKQLIEQGRKPENVYQYFMGILRNWKEGEGEQQPQQKRQATKPTAWQDKQEEEQTFLKNRRESIKAKAQEIKILDWQYRTLN